VAVLPIANTLKGFTGSLFDRFLVPYFYEANRPIRQGDRFIVDEDMMHVEFEVVKVDPPEYGIVTQDTVIYYGGEPIQCAGEDPDLFEVQCNSVTTCGNIRSQVNYAALSIPFIIVRLVYTLLNGFDKQLLSSGSSAISDIARAAMVILMEVFILTIFLFIDFCDPISTISKDEVLFAEEGESIKS
jgi:hypothetical protein